MSIRQYNLGSIVKPGFNPLAAQTSVTTYNLFMWGNNNSGQLGRGNLTSYSSPKQLGSLTNWNQLSGGRNFVIATTTAGTLFAWASNYFGKLGLGNTTNYSSPKQVGALTAWSKISCGGQFTQAIKTDGTLWS